MSPALTSGQDAAVLDLTTQRLRKQQTLLILELASLAVREERLERRAVSRRTAARHAAAVADLDARLSAVESLLALAGPLREVNAEVAAVRSEARRRAVEDDGQVARRGSGLTLTTPRRSSTSPMRRKRAASASTTDAGQSQATRREPAAQSSSEKPASRRPRRRVARARITVVELEIG